MRYLLFTFYAPMASFGEVSVGERRMSWSRPGRSAIMGLVAAAQGIERFDEASHQILETGLYCAVRTDAPGRPMIDYHTTQAPKARRGRTFVTRRQELESDDLNTVLSSREWRTDACFTVALWVRPNADVDLDAIADALRNPHFTLYAGRKAAPLGLPLDPTIIEADSFRSAFHIRQPIREGLADMSAMLVKGEGKGELAFDHDAPDAPPDTRLERRRDGIVSRKRWQFADRLEGVASGEANGS